MFRSRMLALAGALALSVSLAGCGTLFSASGTTPAQANTVAAAEQSYTELAKLETAYAKSGLETKAQAIVIKSLDNAVYADIVAARTAVANNDNPAAAAALQLFNQGYASLTAYLAQKNGGSP